MNWRFAIGTDEGQDPERGLEHISYWCRGTAQRNPFSYPEDSFLGIPTSTVDSAIDGIQSVILDN
jgi:hypothetical protein